MGEPIGRESEGPHLIGQIPNVAATRFIASNPFDFIATNLIAPNGRLRLYYLTVLKGPRSVHAAHFIQDLEALLHAQKVVHHRESILIHIVDDVPAQILITTLAVGKEKRIRYFDESFKVQGNQFSILRGSSVTLP